MRTLIGDADEAENGPMGMFNKIVNTGLAVGRTAFAVTTGVGAFAEVARGFATIQDVAAGSLPIGEVIDEVKAELNERGQNKLVENLDDVGKAGKSLFDLGKLTFELAGITAQHPDPRIQQVAELQREQLLLHKDVALHKQMEKEAQLGIGATTAERTAINQNIAVSNKVATDLDNKVELDQATVLEPLIASARHVLDVLGVHVFATIRAKEIYLALDPSSPRPARPRPPAPRPRADGCRRPPCWRPAAQGPRQPHPPDHPMVLARGRRHRHRRHLSRGPISFSFSTSDA